MDLSGLLQKEIATYSKGDAVFTIKLQCGIVGSGSYVIEGPNGFTAQATTEDKAIRIVLRKMKEIEE